MAAAEFDNVDHNVVTLFHVSCYATRPSKLLVAAGLARHETGHSEFSHLDVMYQWAQQCSMTGLNVSHDNQPMCTAGAETIESHENRLCS